MFSPLVFAVGFVMLAIANAQSGPLVETTLGKIRGSVMKTQTGLEFNAFRGIRYAQAPIGDRRFKAPLAVAGWDGELDATKDGFVCPQSGDEQVVQYSEDCLFLNVYSRNLTANMSVVVWIHGGSFIYGSSHSVGGFGPQYLLDTDIVLVTFNYRLGAFGFLSLNHEEASGSYAYKDQVMVLQWVRDHISKFGGNPESVTLFGMSAGGMAVSFHIASQLSHGLFHKAIAMSGSSTNEIVIDNVKLAQQLAHETSCPMYNPEDVVSCLRELPWQTIVRVCEAWQFYRLYNIKWGFEPEGFVGGSSLTEAYVQGNFTKMPILTGLTMDEFTYMIFDQENNTGLFDDVSYNFDKYAQEFFMHNFDDTKKLNKLKFFYLGNRTINEQNLTHFGEIFSDSFIGHGVHRLVDLSRKHVDVYYYRFDYAGRYGVNANWEGKPRGVTHGDEMLYINTVSPFPSFTPQDPEWFMVERMVGMISSFAQNGVPQDMGEVKWLATNKTHLNTMYIDTEPEMGYAPFTERFRLWDTMFPYNGAGTIYTTSVLTFLGFLVHIVHKFLF